jgi:hypothetical protein
MTRDHVTLRSVPDIPDCPHCKTPMRLIGASPSEVPKIRMETRVFVFRRRSPVGSRPCAPSIVMPSRPDHRRTFIEGETAG